MIDTTDYYLIRAIKVAVYRITDIGDNVEIRMMYKPQKAVAYKFLQPKPSAETSKVKLTIEAEAKKVGLLATQELN